MLLSIGDSILDSCRIHGKALSELAGGSEGNATKREEASMTRPRGLLSPADPATLDEGLRRLLATWSEKAYHDHNMLLTLARRPGMLRAAMGFVRYMYGESCLEPQLLELVRIKLAWNNQCRH